MLSPRRTSRQADGGGTVDLPGMRNDTGVACAGSARTCGRRASVGDAPGLEERPREGVFGEDVVTDGGGALGDPDRLVWRTAAIGHEPSEHGRFGRVVAPHRLGDAIVALG